MAPMLKVIEEVTINPSQKSHTPVALKTSCWENHPYHGKVFHHFIQS